MTRHDPLYALPFFYTYIRLATTFWTAHLTPILQTWKIGWAPSNATKWQMGFNSSFNPLYTELNPICPLLALLGAHHILHVSGFGVERLKKKVSSPVCLGLWRTNRTGSRFSSTTPAFPCQYRSVLTVRCNKHAVDRALAGKTHFCLSLSWHIVFSWPLIKGNFYLHLTLLPHPWNQWRTEVGLGC